VTMGEFALMAGAWRRIPLVVLNCLQNLYIHPLPLCPSPRYVLSKILSLPGLPASIYPNYAEIKELMANSCKL